MVVIKKWFEKLKRGVKGDLVRDYSSITRDEDCLDAKLLREMNGFSLTMTVSNKEHGKADFKVPVTAETLHVLTELVEDIKSVRKRRDKFKKMKLRFRDGEIDLVVTYKHSNQMHAPRQRTAPLNSRVLKLFEELQSDTEALLDSELSPSDIDDF